MDSAVKMEPLSGLIHESGRIVEPSRTGLQIHDLDYELVVRLFERHGALLFRGFDLTVEKLIHATDRFTETYAKDAKRRPRRFGRKEIGNVDAGGEEIGLHSEAAFSPTWPELIWFYCKTPSSAGARTTICDGIRLWNELSPSTQRFFLAQPVRYHYVSELGVKSDDVAHPRVPWPFQAIGVDGFWDRENAVADLSVVRFAVQEARTRKLCFANHLFTEIAGLETAMADGSPVPSALLTEIREAARAITYEVQWQQNDLLMLDNRRFVHGRRKFDSDRDTRDIVQVQTALVSFAYGATVRKSRRPRGESR